MWVVTVIFEMNGQFGKVRLAEEKRLRDPDDVFTHAKECKRELRKGPRNSYDQHSFFMPLPLSLPIAMKYGRLAKARYRSSFLPEIVQLKLVQCHLFPLTLLRDLNSMHGNFDRQNKTRKT